MKRNPDRNADRPMSSSTDRSVRLLSEIVAPKGRWWSEHPKGTAGARITFGAPASIWAARFATASVCSVSVPVGSA